MDAEIARRCKECGASVRAGARFCPQCGKAMVKERAAAAVLDSFEQRGFDSVAASAPELEAEARRSGPRANERRERSVTIIDDGSSSSSRQRVERLREASLGVLDEPPSDTGLWFVVTAVLLFGIFVVFLIFSLILT